MAVGRGGLADASCSRRRRRRGDGWRPATGSEEKGAGEGRGRVGRNGEGMGEEGGGALARARAGDGATAVGGGRRFAGMAAAAAAARLLRHRGAVRGGVCVRHVRRWLAGGQQRCGQRRAPSNNAAVTAPISARSCGGRARCAWREVGGGGTRTGKRRGRGRPWPRRARPSRRVRRPAARARPVKPGHTALNYLLVSGATSLSSFQPAALHRPQKPVLVVLLRNSCDHLFRRRRR